MRHLKSRLGMMEPEDEEHAEQDQQAQDERVVGLGCVPRVDQRVVDLGCGPRVDERVVDLGCVPRVDQRVVDLGCVPRVDQRVVDLDCHEGIDELRGYASAEIPARALRWTSSSSSSCSMELCR